VEQSVAPAIRRQHRVERETDFRLVSDFSSGGSPAGLHMQAPGPPAQTAAAPDLPGGASRAIELLHYWPSWARRSRLHRSSSARTIRAQRAGIVAAIEHGLSNARVEAINT
jgi:hypothetical protein